MLVYDFINIITQYDQGYKYITINDNGVAFFKFIIQMKRRKYKEQDQWHGNRVQPETG
jgi:hypothetical protein